MSPRNPVRIENKEHLSDYQQQVKDTPVVLILPEAYKYLAPVIHDILTSDMFLGERISKSKGFSVYRFSFSGYEELGSIKLYQSGDATLMKTAINETTHYKLNDHDWDRINNRLMIYRPSDRQLYQSQEFQETVTRDNWEKIEELETALTRRELQKALEQVLEPFFSPNAAIQLHRDLYTVIAEHYCFETNDYFFHRASYQQFLRENTPLDYWSKRALLDYIHYHRSRLIARRCQALRTHCLRAEGYVIAMRDFLRQLAEHPFWSYIYRGAKSFYIQDANTDTSQQTIAHNATNYNEVETSQPTKRMRPGRRPSVEVSERRRLAMVIRAEHPDWTIQEIANEIYVRTEKYITADMVRHALRYKPKEEA